VTDPKIERLNSIRFRHNAASTDWSLRESSAGRSLYASIIPQEPPALVLIFDGQTGTADENFLCFAHEDMRFVLDLLDEAFAIIRNLRRALDREPKPKDYAAQCAMLCDKPAFQRFLTERHGLENQNRDAAASRVRSIVNISSRTELNTNPAAADGWKKLYGDFEAWRKQG
jgi:hypothetical protein